ncbi:MAG TPA: hypothetical protein VGF94_03940 [Kofleriaceae bacterium]
MAVALELGCSTPARHPREAPIAAMTIEVGRAGAQLRGVAGDGERVYVAFAEGPRSVIEARRGASVVWSAPLSGTVGPLARGPVVVVAAVAGTGDAGAGPVRGEPGAALVGLDPGNGTPRWRLALDSTAWVTISALAVTEDSVIVGGTFAGSLRGDARVVTSAGGGDGFVARVRAGDGAVEWLARVGGPGADAVLGVAAAGGRVAIAGTFAPGAELRGHELAPIPTDQALPFGDAFVAELDARGDTVVWTATFGSKLDDSVAGVALARDGSVAVAATIRDVAHVGSIDVTARGPADGLVAWFAPDGTRGATAQLGGADFDGLSAITAAGDRAIVGGFFAGSLTLAGQTFTAGGGDDAFFAAVDERGAITHATQVGGDGREELVALSPVPAGFIAGIAHSARASIDGVQLPSPADPNSGAALVVRPFP